MAEDISQGRSHRGPSSSVQGAGHYFSNPASNGEDPVPMPISQDMALFNFEMVADGLTTVSEAAKFLALSKSKPYLLMDAGMLPYFQEGKSRRIPRRALKLYAMSKLQGGWNVGAGN